VTVEVGPPGQREAGGAFLGVGQEDPAAFDEDVADLGAELSEVPAEPEPVFGDLDDDSAGALLFDGVEPCEVAPLRGADGVVALGR
jgi:hypothetical protein